MATFNNKVVGRILLFAVNALCCMCELIANESRIVKRVLVGSPICKNPRVLREFLNGLLYLEKSDCLFEYLFIDDNRDTGSSNLLGIFAKKVPQCTVVRGWIKTPPKYPSRNSPHAWDLALVRKVGEYKDFIIRSAIQNESDYLLLIDADLLLHSATVEHLIRCNKDIISEIFWTNFANKCMGQWENVWDYDVYSFACGTHLRLKKAGIHPVGGLGACTLISRKALAAGVKFKELKSLSFFGEDRQFCVRAVALGFRLYVDTTYPAFHMYFDSDLNRVETFKLKNFLNYEKNNFDLFSSC